MSRFRSRSLSLYSTNKKMVIKHVQIGCWWIYMHPTPSGSANKIFLVQLTANWTEKSADMPVFGRCVCIHENGNHGEKIQLEPPQWLSTSLQTVKGTRRLGPTKNAIQWIQISRMLLFKIFFIGFCCCCCCRILKLIIII